MSSMKAVLALAALCVRSGLSEAQGFEGEITMLVTGGRNAAPQTITMLNRGGNVRATVNTPAGPAVVLGLAAEGKTYLLIESQRTYIDVTPKPGDSLPSAGVTGTPTVQRTATKDTVAGYACEETLVRDGAGVETRLCVTKALGAFVNPLASMSGVGMSPWQQQLSRDGGFPLRVRLADGTTLMEVTKVVRRRVNDTQFRIPADYTLSRPR